MPTSVLLSKVMVYSVQLLIFISAVGIRSDLVANTASLRLPEHDNDDDDDDDDRRETFGPKNM